MRLRDEIEIEERDQVATLFDPATGLRLVVATEVAQLLRQLGEQAEPAVDPAHASLLQSIRELGLLRGTLPEQARVQQARYILRDADYAELPRLRETVRRAYRHTALHREQLGPAFSADGPWDLERLPLLHKTALRRHFPRGLTVDTLDLAAALRCGDLSVASTSGSTGERVQVYSDTRLPRLPADFASLWGLTLPSERPLRTAVLTSPACSAGVCTRRNMSMQERIAFEHTLFLECARDPFELTRAQVATIADELSLFEPDLWLVNPVYLQLVSECAERFQIELPRPRAIVSTYQASTAAQRARFARCYGLPLFQLYSATELGGSQIGISCRHGALHVRLDHCFLELVRDGARVAPGALGNPVVTTHHPSMPLVRYALTDLARFALTPCACEVGSAWPTLILEGRERDAFVRAGELVTTSMIDQALSDLPLALYQLSEPQPGSFELRALLNHGATLSLAQVSERLSPLLQPSTLELSIVQRLPFEDSGKFRYTLPFVEPCDV